MAIATRSSISVKPLPLYLKALSNGFIPEIGLTLSAYILRYLATKFLTKPTESNTHQPVFKQALVYHFELSNAISMHHNTRNMQPVF